MLGLASLVTESDPRPCLDKVVARRRAGSYRETQNKLPVQQLLKVLLLSLAGLQGYKE